MKGDDAHVAYCVATKGTIYVNVIKKDNLTLTSFERTETEAPLITPSVSGVTFSLTQKLMRIWQQFQDSIM